jgi:hypothetical protein
MIEDGTSRKNSGAPDFLWNSLAFSGNPLTQRQFVAEGERSEKSQRARG